MRMTTQRLDVERRLAGLEDELIQCKTRARRDLEKFYRDHQACDQRIETAEREREAVKTASEHYGTDDTTRRIVAALARQRDVVLRGRARRALRASLDYAERQSDTVLAHVSTDFDTAIASLHSLWSFHLTLADAVPSLNHLSTHLFRLAQWTWKECLGALSNDLLRYAEQFGWPTPIRTTIVGSKTEAAAGFIDAFTNLLRLQDECPSSQLADTQREPLYPLQALMRPIILRFRFHFDRQTSTNRIDKPEWMFSQVIATLQEHAPFMQKQVQALLVASPFEARSAWTDMARLLQTVLAAKIKVIIPVLLPKPDTDKPKSLLHTSGLLSHLVYQTLQYDSKIQSLGLTLPPLVEDILGNKAWYDAWLQAEREFAIGRYEGIIFSAEAWRLESDLQPIYSADIRPSQCARQLAELLTTITDRYRPLPHFRYQAPFLLEIQVHLLESMEARLSSMIEAFDSSHSTLFRAVASTTSGARATPKEDPLLALVRMARCWSSAMWLASFCRSWSDDGFFLLLWQKITTTTTSSSGAPSVGGKAGVNDEENGIFYALANVFERDARRAQAVMRKFMAREIKNASRDYLALRDWGEPAIAGSASDEEDTRARSAVTPELQPALATYASLFGTLCVYMPSSDLTTLHSGLVEDVTLLFQQRLIERNNWSLAGQERLKNDIRHGWMAVSEALSPSVATTTITTTTLEDDDTLSPVALRIAIDRGPDYSTAAALNPVRRPSKAWASSFLHVAAEKIHVIIS